MLVIKPAGRRALVFVLVAPCFLELAINGCISESANPGLATTDASPAPEDGSSSVVDAAPPPRTDAGVDVGADGASDAPLTCSGFSPPIEYDAAGLDGAASVNADGGGSLPGPAPAVCSLLGDTHAPFEVINNSPCPVDVWWVGYDCKEYYWGTAPPNGGTFQNNTWETAPWRIRLAGSEVLLRELPPLAEEAADASLRTFTYP